MNARLLLDADGRSMAPFPKVKRVIWMLWVAGNNVVAGKFGKAAA
jgi:hypothetical protein